MEKHIGIDVGTTTITILVEENNEIIDKITFDNKFLETKNNYEKIQNPDVIYSKVKEKLNKLIKKHHDIKAIGITGQMHGIVYVDEDINAISPLYTWQDKRSELLINEENVVNIINCYSKEKIKPGYGFTTYLWNQKNNFLTNKKYKILTIHAYIANKLSNNRDLMLHSSDAHSFGLFDLVKVNFDFESISKLGIDISVLPKVVYGKYKLGEYQRISVYAAIGDNQASYLGTVLNSKKLLLNVGTGSQTSFYTNTISNINEKIEIRPFINKDEYLLVGASPNGGKSYELLAKFFQSYSLENISVVYEKMNNVNKKVFIKVLDSDLEFIPSFYGTRLYSNQKAEIRGITFDNFDFDHFVASLVKGIAKELYDLTIKMVDIEKIDTIYASGNGYRKNILLQKALKHMFKKEILLSHHEEEAGYGAIILVK